MGSGKTTLSKLLNKKLEGTARVPLDEIKKYISGAKKDSSNKKISQKMVMMMTEEYLKSGISVITEWAMKDVYVQEFIKIAKENNAFCFIFQLTAPKEVLIERVKERTRILLNKPKLQKKNIENIEKHFKEHYDFHLKTKYTGAVIVDSEKLNLEQIVKLVLKEIKK